ncbi:VWA domain-containing protein [Gilliamella apicola]|uniref:VWA domain-containing protein n=1 Tax=Gilliamella apicola TaxID=1196095 RepID=A0A556RIZ2_9GAMM|nr:VWA domain-containing protein [Gilliamella apicola]TSJ88836.1 VWA domain-containing protein [Gilliamella apicola]
MQRITRIIFDHGDSDKVSLLKEYNSLLVLLKNNLTERTFSILGQPKLIENNQYIGWYSNLEGQPILLNDIEHEEHKKQIEKTLNTRINDLELVTKSMSLTSEEQALISAWLPRIKNPGNTIYVINDDPVIVNSFKDPILPNPTAIPPASKSFWRWWYFLLLALFLIVLLGLIWFFFCPYGKEKVSDTPSIIAQNTEKNRIESTPIVEQPNVLEPKTEPVAEVKNCITTEEATDNKSASKMVMIFDNSASMTLTLMESQESIDKYLKSNFYSMTEKEAEAYETKMTRLPNRLSSSKEVALTSIDKIQQNIDISLVTLTSCPAAQTTSFYPYKDREKLKSKIKGLQPLENNSATPLYSGVKQASKMLDGINRDDYILIISDGEDNCTKSNICALANEISTTQPRLKINIVDIAGQHKIDCVAKSTGGNVYIAQNPTELINQMSNAVSNMNISKPICK